MSLIDDWPILLFVDLIAVLQDIFWLCFLIHFWIIFNSFQIFGCSLSLKTLNNTLK